MPNNYSPKTDGETLIRHQIARVKTRIRKMEANGLEYKEPLITIPLAQAEDIIKRFNKRKDNMETLRNIAGELSFQLDGEYVQYNVSALRKLSDKLIAIASEIK
jgi:hypothetical protein